MGERCCTPARVHKSHAQRLKELFGSQIRVVLRVGCQRRQQRAFMRRTPRQPGDWCELLCMHVARVGHTRKVRQRARLRPLKASAPLLEREPRGLAQPLGALPFAQQQVVRTAAPVERNDRATAPLALPSTSSCRCSLGRGRRLQAIDQRVARAGARNVRVHRRAVGPQRSDPRGSIRCSAPHARGDVHAVALPSVDARHHLAAPLLAGALSRVAVGRAVVDGHKQQVSCVRIHRPASVRHRPLVEDAADDVRAVRVSQRHRRAGTAPRRARGRREALGVRRSSSSVGRGQAVDIQTRAARAAVTADVWQERRPRVAVWSIPSWRCERLGPGDPQRLIAMQRERQPEAQCVAKVLRRAKPSLHAGVHERTHEKGGSARRLAQRRVAKGVWT
eukprot:1635177-Prymnesium_polylepis.1